MIRVPDEIKIPDLGTDAAMLNVQKLGCCCATGAVLLMPVVKL